MNTFFFSVSKIAWMLFCPDSFLVLLMISSFLLIWLKAYGKAMIIISILTLAILLITVLPLGHWLMFPLEKRFPPQTELPEKVDGIIVLSGAEKGFSSFVWQQVELNQFSERLFSFIQLVRKYPHARHVFTGGSGDLFRQEYKQAVVAKRLFQEQGLDISALIFESQSRNTFENALFTKKLVNPGPEEKWILITSASHMPRSFGIFQKIGWNVIPYSVDHSTNPENLFRLTWNFSGNLSQINGAIREWIGLFAYYHTGKTLEVFPRPLDLK